MIDGVLQRLLEREDLRRRACRGWVCACAAGARQAQHRRASKQARSNHRRRLAAVTRARTSRRTAPARACARVDERLAAGRRRAVHAPVPPAVQRRAGAQVALPLHAVQDRIQRAGAQPIAVPAQLVDHRLAEDRALRGVMENVEPDQSGVEIAIYHRNSSSKVDIGIGSYPEDAREVKRRGASRRTGVLPGSLHLDVPRKTTVS